MLATLSLVLFVGVVYGGTIVYEWYSTTYTIQGDFLLSFDGTITGNLTVHYNQTVTAKITNHADSAVTGTVLVEVVNSIDNSTVSVIHNQSETIYGKTAWQMDPQVWTPNATGTYRIHIKIINPQWSS
jgi:hypothetical protein